MKKVYFLTSSLKSKLVAVALCSTLALISSCKDDEVSPYEDVTVQFKVEATPQVMLKAVVTQVGVEQFQNLNVAGTSYSTTPQVVSSAVGSLHLAATAQGFDPDSKLIVRILVNGQQKATDTVKGGGNLTAKAYYSFFE